jgi:LysM repeat protein
MNNPNPFVPKGSLLEQQSKRRSRLKLAVFCVLAVGVTSLAAMLIQGCKREQPVENGDNSTPTIDTNATPVADTNAPVIDTNAPVVPPTASNLPPTTVEPPLTPATTEYAVVKGDSLTIIAKKNGVTLKALEAANPGVVPTKLKIGQKLVIPAGGSAPTAGADSTGVGAGSEVYTVKSGDTLTRIAHTHGTTVKAIQAENNLTTTHIRVGEKLKIPVKAQATPAAATPEPAPVTPPTVAPVTPSGTTSTN